MTAKAANRGLGLRGFLEQDWARCSFRVSHEREPNMVRGSIDGARSEEVWDERARARARVREFY